MCNFTGTRIFLMSAENNCVQDENNFAQSDNDKTVRFAENKC